MSIEKYSREVLVDMDGVMADFDGEVQKRAQDRYPHIKPLELETPQFYTANNYPNENQDKIWAVSNEAGFIAELPLVSGALMGWQKIIEKGFRPRVCSTLLPEKYYPTCKEEKLAWLEEHFAPEFGHWVLDTAIFTKHKQLVPAAAIIDDKPSQLFNKEGALWEHIIFDRACNRDTELKQEELRLKG